MHPARVALNSHTPLLIPLRCYFHDGRTSIANAVDALAKFMMRLFLKVSRANVLACCLGKQNAQQNNSKVEII